MAVIGARGADRTGSDHSGVATGAKALVSHAIPIVNQGNRAGGLAAVEASGVEVEVSGSVHFVSSDTLYIPVKSENLRIYPQLFG